MSVNKIIFVRFDIIDETTLIAYSFRVKIGDLNSPNITCAQIIKTIHNIIIIQEEEWILKFEINMDTTLALYNNIKSNFVISLNEKLGLSPADTEFSSFKITDIHIIMI